MSLKNLKITDYPSDTGGEFGDLRKVLMKAHNKCSAFPNKLEKFQSILDFACKEAKVDKPKPKKK